MTEPHMRRIMLELKRFDYDSAEILKKEWEYIRDLSADENGFTNGAAGIAWEDFLSGYVPKRRQFESGEGLAKGLVRQIDFFLWCGGEIAGLFRIRPELNDFLRTVTGGHIGYGICPQFRGKGFATEGLRLALSELKKLTTDNVALLFCRKDNAASLRVMQKNDGKICGETEGNFRVEIVLRRKIRYTF